MKTFGFLKVYHVPLTCLIVGISYFTCSGVDAQLLDDFESSLAGFTSTVILDNNDGASNTFAWEITDGRLGLTTTTFDGIEQYAYIRDGASLGVGEELQLDMTTPISGTTNAARNFGLYVGGTAPATGVRQDYISLYGEVGSDTVFKRGFDGSTEYPNLFLTDTLADRIFIARVGVNEFEVGVYSGTDRSIITTITPETPNTADFIGIYADVRETGTVGFGDNLMIATAPVALLGDFNSDGNVDLDDLDQYIGNIDADATGDLEALDLDGDGTVGANDFERHYTELVEAGGVNGTFAGDANLDGAVDVLNDAFILVANLGSAATSWSEGDFNGDGTVNVLGDAFGLVANLGNDNGGGGPE